MVFSILVMVSSGQAADIRIVGIGSSYQLKITGPVKPGDNDKIRVAITEKAAFPDALLVEGDAGDIAESMAIGNFVRNNMLAVTAGKNCSNTCFLIWAAGIHRGELTDQQELDRQAIQALQSMEASLNAMGMGGSSMYTVSAETQREAARAQEFSPQYREELQKNHAEISTCRKNVIAAVREEQGST